LIRLIGWKTPAPASAVCYPYCYQGYAYLTGRFDSIDRCWILPQGAPKIARPIGLKGPLHSMELEFGPSQVEFVFRPGKAFDLRTT